MGNDAFKDLVGQVQSSKLSRRQFMQRAAALGVSATAVSGVLRAMPTRAQDSKEITFWTTFTNVDLDHLQAVVDPYNQQAQGHQIKLTQIPPAQVTNTTQLMTAVRGGVGPDVYLLDRFIVAQRAADGLLEDLSSVGADDVISGYIPFAKSEASYNGKVWALPFDTDDRALFYNKDLLTASGVDPAELDSAKGPVTWDKVAELAAKVDKKDSNGNYSQMGFIPWLNQGWHYTYGFSFGGSFFDQASCSVTPDDPKIVEAFTWVQNYCNTLGADAVQAFGGPSMQPGADPTQDPFYAGKLGMVITGDWVIANIKQYAPDMKYGITYMPVPKTGDKPVTWAGGWSVVIPKGAKNPEEAWSFMKFFAGPDGQKVYTKVSNHLPTLTALASDATLISSDHKFMADMLATAKNRPPLPVGAKYWDELSAAWQKDYLNQGKPADLLKGVKDAVNKDLQKYCPIS
jgi:multiple sugar transport system substrate-binding protein